MSRPQVHLGFVPLTDCAVPVLAVELGFAQQEGLDVILHREASWSALRDKLAMGHLDAAHMLSPVPVAMSMGLGGMAAPMDALQVLSINGDVVGVSSKLARRMEDHGLPNDFMAADAIGRTLIAALDRPLRLGVPFPFSMHAELVYYWLDSLGLASPGELSVRTVPPSMMHAAMADDEIDAFCVGEPWGSIAVERGVAELILPGAAIWRFSPEKVLASRGGWADAEPETATALMRACWRTARWLSEPDRMASVATLLSEERYINAAADVIERGLSGRLVVSPGGSERTVPRFIEFFGGAATFPWRSQAVWMATRLARRNGLDVSEAASIGRRCFRTDLYRRNLEGVGADMPGASEKLEGALAVPTAVASSAGEMILGPDAFFDGKIFDPSAL